MSQLDETDDDRVVAAVKDYMRMLDAGNAPSHELFLQQHADIADELGPSLEGLALVHRAAEPKSSSMVVPDAEFTAKPIGDFQIVGELGRGGMGVVYEAIQLSLGRHVALKVLPFASGLDEVRLQRFRNEAHAAAALHHTNIVPVYAVGSDRGVHYYAMQMIDGSTLAELIENMRAANDVDLTQHVSPQKNVHPSPADASRLKKINDTVVRHSTILNESSTVRQRYYQSVVRMTHQAAVAIQHAHQYGVVHRDIKPANLLLDSVGKIWVTDFGLAQVQNEASNLTRTGDPMGTLRYMSPEQAAGRRDELDHRTDIYSLGVTLYELLTLRPAIEGDGYREMLNNVALHDPPSPKSLEPTLPTELDTIVRKAIAKVPGDRYASAGALAEDLQAWLDDKPIAAKPPTVWERATKWRRRNSGLVAVASGMLLLATLSLLITTLMIWREQHHTSDALARETQQRLIAQRNFQQARDAVDSFSTLSESELAYRPDLQDLRRSFLETSLSFYQDFLENRAEDPQLASDLEATSARVQKMVDELRVLDNLAPLLQLSDRRVQEELGIQPDAAAEIDEAIIQFEEQRDSFANQFIGGFATNNEEMSTLISQFDQSIRERLDDSQLKRLRQIARQKRLPFTFKTSAVVAALGLTRQQRDDVNRIIEETRPNRNNKREGDGREGPGRGGPPKFGGPQGRSMDDRHKPHEFGADGQGPDAIRHERFGDRRSIMNEMWRSLATENTVNHILEILTPQQRQKWDDLIGEPFEG
ncbi:serine/threonine protein kinase [Novipirellula sp. SH528]|uniref:serine/threonine protein kinase n=1 Tax=Novipirellula sp. SH528 TaxID=3454466 RepID=UPI003F9F341F